MMRHHPQIGLTYVPGARYREPLGKGGYLVQTNAAGYRSDREFDPARPPGTFRALLFGDSQTAGDGVANADRFSDLVERAVPGLQVYNFGLGGTGPDQQYLAWQEHAAIPHDLVIIAVYTENIGRVASRVVRYQDSDGEPVYAAKPYFQIRDGTLALCGTPVPKTVWRDRTLPAALRPHVYDFSQANFTASGVRRVVGRAMRHAPMRLHLRNAAIRVQKFQPLPDYDTAEDPKWQLLRAILADWIAASGTPVLVVPIPHPYYFVAASDPGGYGRRFGELARDTGCHLHDPLAALLRHPAAERAAFWSEEVGHLSRHGHQKLAALLAPVIAGLMPGSAAAG